MKYLSSILMGIGLAIVPIQRFHVVAIMGLTVIILVSMWITYKHWREVVRIPRTLLILVSVFTLLMLIIPGSILYAKLFAVALFCIFFAANVLGPKMLTFVGIGAVLGGLSVLIYAVISNFSRTGGIYKIDNYNIAAGTILVGAIFWRWKYQWVTVPIAVLGAVLTGADEAFVIIAILGIIILIRRDWSRKLIPTLLVLLIPIVLLIVPNNPVQKLWATVPATFQAVVQHETLAAGQVYETSTNLYNRWNSLTNSLEDFKFQGHGYAPTNTLYTSIHSVAPRVLYELGVFGVLTWLGLIVYGLKKTTWKYAFIVIIAAGLFDHFMWTQLAPYFFVLLGISSWYKDRGDLIFKERCI